MSTQSNRVRSNDSLRIDVLRKRIDRAITKAFRGGLTLGKGVWCEGNTVCPISARILYVKGPDAGRQLVDELESDGGDCKLAGRNAGMTPTEVYYFIDGFDGNRLQVKNNGPYRLTNRGRRAFALGQSFAERYL